ncbi:hypothetical protein [Nostoc sp.]|uniref:hypothetical protein n=1 Tax=Nostoc sp. TaxID=1180 RepID=UPI002FF9ACC5
MKTCTSPSTGYGKGRVELILVSSWATIGLSSKRYNKLRLSADQRGFLGRQIWGLGEKRKPLIYFLFKKSKFIYAKKEKFLPRLLATRYKASKFSEQIDLSMG